MDPEQYSKKREDLEDIVNIPPKGNFKDISGLLNPYIWEPAAFFIAAFGGAQYSQTHNTAPGDPQTVGKYLLAGAIATTLVGIGNDIKERHIEVKNPFLRYSVLPSSLVGFGAAILGGGYLFPELMYTDSEPKETLSYGLYSIAFVSTHLSFTALRSVANNDELRKEHKREYNRNLPTRIYDSLFDTPILSLPIFALASIGTSRWSESLLDTTQDGKNILAFTMASVAAFGSYAFSNSIGYNLFHSSNLKHNFYSVLSTFFEIAKKYDKAADYREKILELPITKEDEFSQRITLVKLGRDELYHSRRALELGISDINATINTEDKKSDSNLQSLAKAFINGRTPIQQYHLLKTIEEAPNNPDLHFMYSDWLRHKGLDHWEEDNRAMYLIFESPGIESKFQKINEGRHEVGLVEVSKDSLVVFKRGTREQMDKEAEYTNLVHSLFPKNTVGISSHFGMGSNDYLAFRFAGTRLYDLAIKNQAKTNDFWQVLRFLAAYYPAIEKEGIEPNDPINSKTYTDRNGSIIQNSSYFQNRFNDLAKGYMQDVFGLEFPKSLNSLAEFLEPILHSDQMVLACDPNWKNSYITKEDKLIQADFEFPKLFPLRLELEKVVRFGPGISQKDIQNLLFNFYMNYEENQDNKPKNSDFGFWNADIPYYSIVSAFDMMGYRARDFSSNGNLADLRFIDFYFDTILGSLNSIEIPDKQLHINSILDLKTQFNASEHFAQIYQAKV